MKKVLILLIYPSIYVSPIWPSSHPSTIPIVLPQKPTKANYKATYVKAKENKLAM